MKISVFGSGYVGLVQAAVMAETGNTVTCVDVDEARVARLRAGEVPIHEPGLDKLLHQGIAAGRLKFTTDAAEGVEHADVIFIAVGTPPDEDGSADLSHVLTVARTIATHMSREKIVVNKSTVPVGTGDKVRAAIEAVLAERGADIPFDVVSNPEFLKEGAAVQDCKRPERIIIGTENPRSIEVLSRLYAPFNRNHDRLIVMDIRSAELTKYAANCMLATKISFINEMARLAEKLGADIEHVRHGIGSDSRIGYQFIYPGCGYGGSCFPKDVKALIHTADSVGANADILKSVESTNESQKQVLFQRLQEHFGGELQGRRIAVWGLAFKPNTDDMREAPSRVLMEALWYAGAEVRAYDPVALDECQRLYGEQPSLHLAASKEAALEGADVLVVCTEWRDFQSPDFEQMKGALKHPVIVDGRNIFDPDMLHELGFTYYAIGRGASVNAV